MFSKAKPPTKRERERMDKIKEAGCILSGGPCEVHHLIAGNKRRGHRFTIGLSPWHHRGVQHDGWSRAEMEEWLGPSLAHGSKPFHHHFGSDDVLLRRQDERIGWEDE